MTIILLQQNHYPAIIRATCQVVTVLINTDLVHSSCMLKTQVIHIIDNCVNDIITKKLCAPDVAHSSIINIKDT